MDGYINDYTRGDQSFIAQFKKEASENIEAGGEAASQNIDTSGISRNGASQSKAATNALAFGAGLHGGNTLKATDNKDTISRSHAEVKGQTFSVEGGDSNFTSKHAFLANSQKESTHEALSDNNTRMTIPEGTNKIEVSDDREIHGNSHALESTQDRPLTIKPGQPDGDTYNVMGSPNSTTTINGASEAEGNGVRDTINYHSHISSPSVENTINLENFNPSKTDLKIDSRSVFGEGFDTELNGSIKIGATDGTNSDRSFEINLEHK